MGFVYKKTPRLLVAGLYSVGLSGGGHENQDTLVLAEFFLLFPGDIVSFALRMASGHKRGRRPVAFSPRRHAVGTRDTGGYFRFSCSHTFRFTPTRGAKAHFPYSICCFGSALLDFVVNLPPRMRDWNFPYRRYCLSSTRHTHARLTHIRPSYFLASRSRIHLRTSCAL